tara:strand:- start:8054 stop:8710 length:657 start_codon:yes stop_codon:yes gene_type:complete
MTKQTIIAIVLLVLLTTITSKQKINTSKFNLKEIKIENNFLIKRDELRKLLIPIYEKNLIFLSNAEVENALKQNDFIKGFNIKKKYPSTLVIKIFERRPIAILIDNQKKFYLSEETKLMDFKILQNYKDLPYIFGNKLAFESFYNDLKKINFPMNYIKKFTLHKSNRWNLETKDKKIIKLPSENYIQSLDNFLNIKDKNDFKKFKIFDYRINSQLILK